MNIVTQDDMKEKEEIPKLLSDQYNQYWQMCRFHLSLSWHIPTLAIAAVLAFVGFDPDKVVKWSQHPFLPAVTLLVASCFVFLMFIHHRRNLIFAQTYENAMEELEREHGKELRVLHHQVQARLTGLSRISSSACLGIFLISLSLLLLAIDIYLWTLAL